MTEELKTEALEIISRLFGDLGADESAQITALEEIRDLCDDNITSLREQIRSRCDE